MAKIEITILFILSILLFSSNVIAEVSSTDKTHIQNQVTIIANSINNNDVNPISNMLSPNARPGLRNEIENNVVAAGMMQFQQRISSYEDLGNNQVKVNGIYAATGPGWNADGMSNYYIFEKSGDSWLLIDTDFHQKLGAGYVFKFIGNIFLIILPFLIIFGAFWLWMLIDCIKRQFEDKMMWILLIIFFSIIGAILYFFMMRKKLIQQEKMIGREKNVR